MLTIQPELYLGQISGTSMDGIDTALVEFRSGAWRLIDANARAYDNTLKKRLEVAKTDPGDITLDEFGMLDRDVGAAFAAAALALLEANDTEPSAVRALGSHGQTLRHRTDVEPPFSLQIGDANTIAATTGITTVADFRRRDIALGGEGAPLAPAFHDWVLRERTTNLAVVNLGGIANVTVLGSNGSVTGFDTGPANCLLDGWVRAELGGSFDDGGQLAAAGTVNEVLLRSLLDDPYFRKPPPKSTGFEYFNLDWLQKKAAGHLDTMSTNDTLATLTELSARSVAAALKRYAPNVSAVYLCGGGVHNPLLGRLIKKSLGDTSVQTTRAIDLEPDWVEAALFAWLARECLAGRPGNVPAVTGASDAAVLGAIYSRQ